VKSILRLTYNTASGHTQSWRHTDRQRELDDVAVTVVVEREESVVDVDVQG